MLYKVTSEYTAKVLAGCYSPTNSNPNSKEGMVNTKEEEVRKKKKNHQ
jgi:hypothetical protein